MDLSQLTRDPSSVKKALTTSDDVVFAKKDCAIYVPSRYQDKNLIFLGSETYVVGVYMMVVGNTYAVSTATTVLRVEPSSIDTVVIDDVEYIELSFEPGDRVIATTQAVMNDKLLYYIMDELIKGNVPPYLNYEDTINIFRDTQYYNGVKLASTPTVLHMLMSFIARDSENPMTYFRQVSDGKDLDKVKYVSLKSSIYGATNTTARLMGSHYADNLTSALVDESDSEERIENILRM